MGRYVVKRLLWMIPITLGVTVLVFTLMTFCPGDPAEIILGSTATEENLEAMREELGLNDPYLVRLGTFLSDTFIRFDFGESWATGASIADAIAERMPRTLILSISMMLISVVIGVPLGVIAAIKQNKWQDNMCMTLALVGISIPNFWLALLLVLLFSVKLDLLPPMGIGGLEYYILPAMAGCTGQCKTDSFQYAGCNSCRLYYNGKSKRRTGMAGYHKTRIKKWYDSDYYSNGNTFWKDAWRNHDY